MSSVCFFEISNWNKSRSFEGLSWRKYTNCLIFLNIIEKQGVNLYIFPHIRSTAQPKTKIPHVRVVFFCF